MSAPSDNQNGNQNGHQIGNRIGQRHTVQEAITCLYQLQRAKEESSQQMKVYSAPASSAKSLLLEYLRSGNVPYVQDATGYWTIEEEKKKYPLDEQLVCTVYSSFREKITGEAPNAAELKTFMNYMDQYRNEFAT